MTSPYKNYWTAIQTPSSKRRKSRCRHNSAVISPDNTLEWPVYIVREPMRVTRNGRTGVLTNRLLYTGIVLIVRHRGKTMVKVYLVNHKNTSIINIIPNTNRVYIVSQLFV